MSGSTITLGGEPNTVEVTNFTELTDFDFGNSSNWSLAAPSVIAIDDGGNFLLFEADIDLPGIKGSDNGSGPITDPFYGVTVTAYQPAASTGLLIPVEGATVVIDGYLEIDWLGIQNAGNIYIAVGGVLQADVPIGTTVMTSFVGGQLETGGNIVNYGRINSGNVISGGTLEDYAGEIPGVSGLISNDTTLEDLVLSGPLDLTVPNYNIIDLGGGVTFGGVLILMNGTGAVLQSVADQTLNGVEIDFGPGVGTIASRGTDSTLTIGSSTSLVLDNTDFYVANTDTLVNDVELDSDNPNQILSFAGQAFIEVIVNPGNGIYVPMAAGVFENDDAIVLSNTKATTTIFDIGFTNEAGALLSVTDAYLGDHQFTSNFENAGSYDIGSNGTVDAYDQSFINDASGVIEIHGNAIGAGTLAIGTLDIQSGGNVFTVAPSLYVNNGLIELDSTAPAGSTVTPEFYIGAGTTFTNTGDILFTNNGTIVLNAGLLQFDNAVTINGGQIEGNGGTILADGATIESATLYGEVNLTTQGGDDGDIWLYDDSYAANSFSTSVINVAQTNIELFLRDDFGLANMVLNLGTAGDTRTTLVLESTTLTVDSSSTINTGGEFVLFQNGVIPNVALLRTTLYNQGLMQAADNIVDVETTGFENSGQLIISDNAEVNLMNASATNLAGGQITIAAGAELSVGD